MAATGRRKARGAVTEESVPSDAAAPTRANTAHTAKTAAPGLVVLGPEDLAGGAVIDGDGAAATLPAVGTESATPVAGLTARVASATFERDGYKHLIKAAEAVYSYPANGTRLSLPAQKMLNFMIHLAGSQNFANKL